VNFILMHRETCPGEGEHPVPRVVAVKNAYMGDYWIIRLRG
jgi:hypothetical protein